LEYYAGFRGFMVGLNTFMTLFTFTVLSLKLRQQSEGNRGFLERLRMSTSIAGLTLIIYSLDPQGWLGIIPLNISWALICFACSVLASGLYMIMTGLLTSLGKVSVELSDNVERIERFRTIVVNFKCLSDFLIIVGLLIFPQYTWLFVALYGCCSSIGYAALVGVTRYCGYKIIHEFESLANTKNGAKLNETGHKLKLFLRNGWISEIPIRTLVIATIYYWAHGKYNVDHYYPKPSLAMAFFVNGIALLESSLLLFFMQLYFQFSLGKIHMNVKETVLMSLMSRVMVSGGSDRLVSSGPSEKIKSSQNQIETTTHREP